MRDQSKADDIHKELVEVSLNPQKNFWQFYSEMVNEEYEPTISYKKKFQLSLDKSIHFHCYNTSLFSMKHETVGSLIVPKSSFYILPIQQRRILLFLLPSLYWMLL